MAVFIETKVFTRRVVELLTDRAYSELQSALAAHPDAGDMIPGSGGLRKLRWLAQGRGKSGGVRVIYFHAISRGELHMLYIYGKNEQDDLSAEQLRLLKRAVEALWR